MNNISSYELYNKYTQLKNEFKVFQREIRQHLEELNKNWKVEERPSEIKLYGSFELKVIKDMKIDDPFSEIDDIIGFKIVVPNYSNIKEVVNSLESSYWCEIHEIKERQIKNPEYFKFLDTKVILKFKPPKLKDNVNHTKFKVKIEISIVTLLEHSLEKLTHNLVYKTKDYPKPQLERLISVLRAELELIDTIIDTADATKDQLVSDELRYAESRTQIKRKLISSYIGKFLSEENLDLRRYILIFESYLNLAGINTEEAIEEFFKKHENSKVHKIGSMSPYTKLIALICENQQNACTMISRLQNKNIKLFINREDKQLCDSLRIIPKDSIWSSTD